MAIGTLAAIGIGLAGAGSAIGGMSKASAAKKAAAAQQQASDQSAAVQREIYGQNKEVMTPFINRGNAAGDSINALLGLGGGQQQLPTPQPNALAQFQGYNPDSTGGVFGMGNDMFVNPRQVGEGEFGGGRFAAGQPGIVGGYASGRFDINGNPVGTQGQPTQQQSANNAFDIFRNSTGYQFRLGEGMRAINGGYAGAGTLQSGAAMKAINDYGQNMASNEFGNYLGYLGNQQGVGLSGASALAGVGQNYANSLSQINQDRADGLGNAALVKGANNPFANALGTLGGGLFKLGG